MSMPVDGPITSPYGMRLDPITHTWRLHSGTDFGASCGTPIRAAATGRVVSVSWHPSYGHRLVMEHPHHTSGTLSTAYNHALGYSAQPGQTIPAGTVIGSVGSTGDSTGCHLHFMVYNGGNVIDPMTLLSP